MTIGTEFYGTVHSKSKPFASLQNFRFKSMLLLQGWLPFRDEDEAINELKLQYCNKVLLNELPPQVLKFTISGYDALMSLPMGNNHYLEELDVSDCPSLRLLPSIGKADAIKSLGVKNCGKLLFLLHQCYAFLERFCIRYTHITDHIILAVKETDSYLLYKFEAPMMILVAVILKALYTKSPGLIF
ncbi:hypothetical protein CMV_011404 [Castanea mollissima]|uniref:Uncharacterized protein n=1 Tax=Castanea mollissima TaxID=60419 RepID=A0A8J4VKU1_9ROSI|nr:hypothetical protein CMV_011404 [Castanea mollissima]